MAVFDVKLFHKCFLIYPEQNTSQDTSIPMTKPEFNSLGKTADFYDQFSLIPLLFLRKLFLTHLSSALFNCK